MGNFLSGQQWIYIALAFFGIIGYIAYIRWQDRKWIAQRFGNRDPIAMSFGVNYFGRATEPGKIRQSSGFLLLFPDRIFYRSRLKKIEVDIPGSTVTRVYHDRRHKGTDLHQSLVKIDFFNSEKQRDCVAFKVPYPPQWIRIIENTLLQKK